MDLSFDGFLSYSTVPDYALARKTESFFEGFHTTRVARALKLPALNICLDGSDFSLAKMQAASTPDAVIAALLYEHLAKCKRLLVFCSRNSATSRFVDLEIEWWLQNRDADSILLIATEGANPGEIPEEIFSQRIRAAGLHLRPWCDFRGFRAREARAWNRVRDAEAERIQLTAHLYGETAGRVYPTWQRARDRTRRVLVAIAATAGIGAIAAGSWYAWTLTDRYQVRKIVDHTPVASGTNPEWVAALVRADRIVEAEAIAVQPDEYTAEKLNALGKQLLAEGKRDEARAVYERALQVPADGRNLMSGADSDILTNSIVLGAREELIAPFRKRYLERLQTAPDSDLGSAAVKLAKQGLYDQAIDLARSMNSALQYRRGDALLGVANTTTDRDKAIAALDEARKNLTSKGRPSALEPTMELSGMANAYAQLGRPADALDVADKITYQKAEAHLSLASQFLAEHNLPMVERAIAQAGPISESSKRVTLDLMLDRENTSGEDVLQLAQYLEPNESERGRFFLRMVAGHADRFVPGTHPGLPAIKPMLAAGQALVAASGPLDAATELAIAKGWILAADFPQARTHLANAARLFIAAKDWYWLGELVTLSVAAKASDDDLAWIESIPQSELREKIRARVPIERKYGPDGRPLPEWLASDEQGAGNQGTPHEQWFRKSVAAGDIKAAIEASKGMNQRSRIMYDAVRELLKRDKVAQAHELTNAITYDYERFRTLELLAPALARKGEIDQAETQTRTITDPVLRGGVMGAVSVAAMPTAPARARKLLDESLDLLRSRDEDVRTIANAFCEQNDVESSRLALAKISRDDMRPGIELCIVGALLNLHRVRDARIAAENITSTSHRKEALTAILNSYAETKLGKEKVTPSP